MLIYEVEILIVTFVCRADKSIYHALGLSTFSYLEAVMTFERVREHAHIFLQILCTYLVPRLPGCCGVINRQQHFKLKLF